MNSKEIRETIHREFGLLYQAANACSPEAAKFLQRAIENAERDERAHRAMGRRFTRGQARYSQSVNTAAKYMVVRWVGDPQANKALPPEELLRMREDVAYCHALRRTLGQAYPFSDEGPECYSRLDYADHIAVK